MHCRILGSISGLYPLNASRTPPHPSCNNQQCLQTLPKVPGRTKFPPSTANKIMFPDITKSPGVEMEGGKITFTEKHSSTRTFIFYANGRKLRVFRANITSTCRKDAMVVKIIWHDRTLWHNNPAQKYLVTLQPMNQRSQMTGFSEFLSPFWVSAP